MKLDPKLQARLGTIFASPDGEQDLPNQLLLVDVERLHTRPQPRSVFDESELRDLETSIRELHAAGQGIGGSGVLQPLLVRSHPESSQEGFLVTAGERRLRAAKAAGVARVPVVVVEAADEDAWEHAIVENLLRADLSPLEEASAFQQLMKARGYSVREAAKRLGKDKGYIENRVRLLKMGEDVREMVSLRKDSAAHARVIDAVKDPQLRAELIRATVEDLASYPFIRDRVEKGAETSSTSTGEPDEVSLRKDTPAESEEDKALARAQFALDATTRKLQNVARSLPNDGVARDELARRIEGSVAQLQELVALLRG